jgi:LacI family transcriptional regulator
MKKWRIGVVIQTQHLHAEDQQLYLGVRDFGNEHDAFDCILAPFAADELVHGSARAKPYDGLLAQATPALVAAAQRLHIPVVDVWRDSPVTKPIHCVCPDFSKAGRMVGQHLVSCGYSHFGYIVNRGVSLQATMCDDRITGGDQLGFSAYIKARGYPCARLIAPRSVHANASVWQRWSETIRAWLQKQPRPLGLFVPNDMLCRHIADLAAELGLGIPLDLGLVCADNEPNFCLLTDPSLTAIDLGYRRVGYEAAALLDRILAHGKGNGEREMVLVDTPVIYPRNSTDATTFRDRLIATAMRFIIENASRSIKVTDVAREVFATRRTLERRFRSVLGHTVMQEITRCRIEQLKRRLTEGDTPIKLLVATSGFNSPRVLYETFIREEGVSPSQYREKRRGRNK